MKTSITKRKVNKNNNNKIKLWAVLFWIIVWQIAAIIIDQEILLVSPLSVLEKLFLLVQTTEFWMSLLFSLFRISLGFFAAVIIAILLAVLAFRFKLIKELLAPFMLTIKSVPVASFVILVLIWFTSDNLAILISFLMVLPVIYTNVFEGISRTDKNLLEMAKVFTVKKSKQMRYIYFFEVYPFFYSALSISLGLCWKAGVAAEVIGIPNNSIGENLFNAKIYLDTAALFAWTVAIIILSLAFEKTVLFILRKMKKHLERA